MGQGETKQRKRSSYDNRNKRTTGNKKSRNAGEAARRKGHKGKQRRHKNSETQGCQLVGRHGAHEAGKGHPQEGRQEDQGGHNKSRNPAKATRRETWETKGDSESRDPAKVTHKKGDNGRQEEQEAQEPDKGWPQDRRQMVI